MTRAASEQAFEWREGLSKESQARFHFTRLAWCQNGSNPRSASTTRLNSSSIAVPFMTVPHGARMRHATQERPSYFSIGANGRGSERLAAPIFGGTGVWTPSLFGLVRDFEQFLAVSHLNRASSRTKGAIRSIPKYRQYLRPVVLPLLFCWDEFAGSDSIAKGRNQEQPAVRKSNS
jgi:hypothetical protein